MKLQIILTVFCSVLLSCSNDDLNLPKCSSDEAQFESAEGVAIKYPACFQENTDRISEESNRKRVYLAKLSYKNTFIYQLTRVIPDASPTTYFTCECSKICSGYDNIAGKPFSDCPSEFLENLEFIEIVWEKPR